MDQEETNRILSGLVRVGTVTNVDEGKRMARVKFQSEDMTSGWLHVLARTGFWLPKTNATVLCVYLPVFNADGFVLGEIGGEGEIKR